MRRCERNNSADTKVREERRGRRCPKCRRREPSVATRDEDRGEAGCSPIVHGGPQWSRSPPVAYGGHHAGAGGRPKEAVTLWRACARADSWQDLWTSGESRPRWSRFAGRACDLVGVPRWSSLFLKHCTPWQGPMLG